ncbi:MAG: DUF4136 domain-containing protein [Gallionellaceae bacterium]|jgi:hypothetical protein|nr:DUF4136 domain-containing protein [Gallionellaceae bacterium]
MKKLFVLAGLAAFVLLATGCATRDSDPRWQDFHDASPGGNIEVQIDSIAAPNLDLKGKTFVIASGMPVVEEADLEFRLVAQYVENALRKHGATRVEKPEDAELLIRIAYGIGDPQQISAYSYMIGWSVQSVNQTVFTRNLIISGYEAKKLQPQLWKTTVRSTGMSPDLRMVMLYLVAAAEPYLGKSTGGVLEESTGDNDSRILDIKFGPLLPREKTVK